MHNETDDEQYHENEEKNLGDSGCCSRYSHKPEDARNNGNDKEYNGPVKHITLLSKDFLQTIPFTDPEQNPKFKLDDASALHITRTPACYKPIAFIVD